MLKLQEQISSAVDYIRSQTQIAPQVAVVLGTGLGALAYQVEESVEIPYEEIPHFSLSTLEAHAGNLVLGTLEGKKVAVMQGRFHYYEGYGMQEITFPIRVAKALGAETLIASNAAGSMNEYIDPGNIMIITDHINLMGDNPLRGINDDSLGPRYPDMYGIYTPELVDLTYAIAMEKKIRVHKGIFVAVSGPNLETPAEYRFLRAAGADAVSMSTVPEVIVAVHSSMKVLGLSCITDKCTPDVLGPVDIGEIIQVANEIAPKLTQLVAEVIKRM
ncbi:purine-nucleoside phosphorylase [Candidatus Poribacteria bacterium]